MSFNASGFLSVEIKLILTFEISFTSLFSKLTPHFSKTGIKLSSIFFESPQSPLILTEYCEVAIKAFPPLRIKFSIMLDS